MLLFFFFNDTATTEIYTLSLHDALPISGCARACPTSSSRTSRCSRPSSGGSRPTSTTTSTTSTSTRAACGPGASCNRSEEHTSELQSRQYLVCRLLLEKKNKYYVLARYL